MGLCIGYTYFKITGYSKINIYIKFIIAFINVVLSILYCLLKPHIENILVSTIIYLIYNLILKTITKNKYGYSLLVIIVSISLCYISFVFSVLIAFTLYELFKFISFDSPINFIFISLIEMSIVYFFFKIKRFKNGFQFLKYKCDNEQLDVLVILISIIIIFIYFLFGNIKNISLNYIFSFFILYTIIMIPILQKTFILYQKQKLLTKTLKEYETEIEETKSKLNTALEEKYKLVKTNHEFYHRQEALKQKLNNLLELNRNCCSSEIAEEYGTILDRIDRLSNEYSSKIKPVPKLIKTGVEEIDDMLLYMQAECSKYNIEFVTKIECDIDIIINKFVSKSKLETLLGDLIRNAIIAINHCEKDYKSIMLIIGLKDNCYEVCIFDSGIDFEIDTLFKLGLTTATTHEKEGGTGIGLITTYELLQETNSSLIINEYTPNNNNYSKSITIKFDNNFNYIINTYRYNDLQEKNKNTRKLTIHKI